MVERELIASYLLPVENGCSPSTVCVLRSGTAECRNVISSTSLFRMRRSTYSHGFWMA